MVDESKTIQVSKPTQETFQNNMTDTHPRLNQHEDGVEVSFGNTVF